MHFYWLVIGSLCVWRITHLLHGEDGPWDLFVRLRRTAGTGVWGLVLDCFYCLSLWVAVPFALLLGEGWKERPLLWLSFSAGAILIERITNHPPMQYFEDKEEENVLLRQEESGVAGNDSAESKL